VLQSIDYDYLQRWGHYRTLVELHGRISERITEPALNASHLSHLGLCHTSLGEYREAIDLHTQALAIARETGDRLGEGDSLGNLGNCHLGLGEYRRAIDLHTLALAVDRETGNRQGEGSSLSSLGSCHYDLGEYRRAIDLYTQALAIAREAGYREGESVRLDNLGLCHYGLGEYRRAIDLHTQALAIARDIGYRYVEANALGYLGRAWLSSGDARQAVTLLGQAVSIADTSGDVQPAVEARTWLARAHLQLNNAAAALAVTAVERELTYPLEEPARRLLEGLALLELDHLDKSAQTFGDALAAADALLTLADRNVVALEVRALELSGLAVVAGDPARAAEAAEAFGRARAVTSAPGVVADTRRLLDIIAKHDRSGLRWAARMPVPSGESA
jgi:tetratricopeptide (TPR) repeat protein